MANDIQSALDRIAAAVEKMAKDGRKDTKLILQSSESEEARHTREYRDGLVSREVILTNGMSLKITIDEEQELITSGYLKPEAKWQSMMNQAKQTTMVLNALQQVAQKPKHVDGEVIDG